MKTGLVFFHTDLRIHDNETLVRAIEFSDYLILLYVLPKLENHRLIPHSRLSHFRIKFLLETLADLDNSLRRMGSYLILRTSSIEQIIPELCLQFSVDMVFYGKEFFFQIFSLSFLRKKHGRHLFLESGIQQNQSKIKGMKGRVLKSFDLWRLGETPDDFINANMKELMLTGYMSNRGRQYVASYLVHQLGLNWRLGAEWFETMLIDFDPASNYGNWNYIAGVGNDPRSRIFNSKKQAQYYDSLGEYTKI